MIIKPTSMRSKINRLSTSFFVRSVFLLTAGSALAQIITFLFVPFLTRLYSPEIFGILGVFMSFVSIISPVAAFCYPIAIPIPKFDSDAINLARLSILIGFFVSFIMVLVFYFLGASLVSIFNLQGLNHYLFLIPLTLFVNVVLQVMQQWFVRKKAYKASSKISIFQSSLTNLAKLIFGYISPTAITILLVTILGNVIYTFLLIFNKKSLRLRLTFLKPTNVRLFLQSHYSIAIKYYDFALFRSPQVFINSISLSFPVLILSAYFGAASAGFYTIANLAIVMPSMIVGKSVSDVFYPRVVDAKRKGENISLIITEATLGMVFIGAIPFLLVFLYGESIFGFILGDQWLLAGRYASWLSIMLFFGFVNKPVVSSIPVLNLQLWLLKYEIFSTFSKIAAILLGLIFLKDDMWSIILFSISGALAYMYLIIKVILVARQRV
jgi:O-antigen/teichoic acid export membrane protein